MVWVPICSFGVATPLKTSWMAAPSSMPVDGVAVFLAERQSGMPGRAEGQSNRVGREGGGIRPGGRSWNDQNTSFAASCTSLGAAALTTLPNAGLLMLPSTADGP